MQFFSKALFLCFLVAVPQLSWGLCVNVKQANLRSKPSARSKLVWTVGRYMPLLEVKQKGDWIQVKDLEGQKMWIHGGLVSEDIDCAVIRVSSANLHKGPGSEFKKTALSSAFKYMPFKKLQREGDWLYLQDSYGQKHWVSDKKTWEPLAYTRLTY